MPSFTKLTTISGATLRKGGIVSGLETSPTVQIPYLLCLPLDPVDPELSLGIEGLGFHELLQTTLSGEVDISEGDILVVEAGSYPIRAIEDWNWKGIDFHLLTLQDMK